DNIQLKRVINVPRRGIGQTTMDRLEQIAADIDSSIYDVALRAGDFSSVRTSETKIKEFTSIIEELRKCARDSSVEEVYDKAVALSGLIDMYEAEGTIEARSRIENIKELKSAIKTSAEEFPELTGEQMTLETFLEGITLSTDAEEQKEGPYVSIMTLHSAKGLEFPTVFIIGMEEGLFPSLMSFSEGVDRMEEERRLCYVGITRAMKEVYLLNTSERTLYGHTQRNIPSRFLGEIKPDLIEYMDSGKRYQGIPSAGKPTSGFTISRGGKPLDISSLGVYAGEAADVKTGQRVLHKKFGEGVVIGSEGSGEDRMIEVDFEESGKKRLMASFARLKILED
ncbi:MAG: ATP-binding domain-containing protein, partial [Clostridia bacterium]|nr:ATP-binding domain-containing protein [Clostridia bacterium]